MKEKEGKAQKGFFRTIEEIGRNKGKTQQQMKQIARDRKG